MVQWTARRRLSSLAASDHAASSGHVPGVAMSRTSVVWLLAGFDEFIWDQCYAMEQSQRID